MVPRIITANDEVKDLNGMVALASGPLVYCLESVDNEDLDKLQLDRNSQLDIVYRDDLLGGVNVIKVVDKEVEHTLTAIPYYTVGNRNQSGYKVWIPDTQKD